MEDKATPAAVELVAQFFAQHRLWYSLSRNPPVLGCKEAAEKRSRLGHTGIPLHDELKSFLGWFVSPEGNLLIAAHCRADRILDMELLSKLVGARSPILKVEETLERFGMDYGLVNPFVIARRHEEFRNGEIEGKVMSDLIQVFDTDLLHRIGLPGSCMTNAGDFTWAVEFYADEVIRAFPEGRIGSFTMWDEQVKHERTQPLKLGIITGNPPEAGLLLHQMINARIRNSLRWRCSGDFSLPPVSMLSIPETGLSMELEHRLPMVWSPLANAVQELCLCGCKIIAVPCNTLTFFSDRLKQLALAWGSEFVSIADACRIRLDADRIKSAALVGIPQVANLESGYSGYRDSLAGIEIEIPSRETLAIVRDIAYTVKQRGQKNNGPAMNRLRDVLKQRITSKTVILALTELSLLFEEQKRRSDEKNIIDPLACYADLIANKVSLRRPIRRVADEVINIP